MENGEGASMLPRLKVAVARKERGLQPASTLAQSAVTEHQTVIHVEAA